MPSTSPLFRPAFAVALAATLFAAVATAQQPARNYNLTDKTSEEMGKLQPLMGGENPNWVGALAVVDAQIGKVEPSSYDMAVLQQIKAQILLRKNELSKAIEPLERCVTLSDAHTPTYFEPRVTQELIYYLSQLYYQEASVSKNPALTTQYFDKAENYMNRWVKSTPKPTQDALLFYASLLYNRATQDDKAVDTKRLNAALDQVDRALRLSTRPRDSFYVLRLACLQQLGRNRESIEILELLVKQKPENKVYWQQLAALYLSIGQDDKTESHIAKEFTIRAIATIERAQSHGTMNEPKDNFNLVGIYFNIGQYEKAAELLEKGLVDGSIDNEQKNWELLSYSYQQLRREFKAIDALERAAKQFPKSGQIHYQIGQAYYSLEKPKEALTHLRLAVQKGNLGRPHQAYLFLAYIAFEMKEFEEALAASNKALEYPEGQNEGKRMKTAIEDAMKDRENKLKNM